MPTGICTSTLTMFFQRTTTTKTSSNITLTDLLLLPKLMTMQLLWPQQLYHTQRAYLRTSCASYNPSISASLTNLLPHNVSYWLTSKTNWKSIAPTAMPPTLVRLAETSQLDWLNTNKWQGKAMSTITLLNITGLRTTLLTGTLCNA